ncbi:MAG TPA: glycosyltransferase family A protein [Chlorobiota bacterium]|nr:glycosyltransferase family A protein [Chlorobiota bacterium]
MDLPFFSVIVCTYNRASLLSRALDSLISQRYKNWEAVIVDDGSTDTTSSVVQRYVAMDHRFVSLYQTNSGTGAARNTGITRSRGQYVTFLDSDDAYAPDHLSIRYDLLQQAPMTDLLHGGVHIIGSPWVRDKDDPSRFVHLDDCVIGGTFVIKRDVFSRLGMFDAVRYADDTMFFDRAMQHGVTIEKTTEPTYIYHRDTPDSLCSTYAP